MDGHISEFPEFLNKAVETVAEAICEENNWSRDTEDGDMATDTAVTAVQALYVAGYLNTEVLDFS